MYLPCSDQVLLARAGDLKLAARPTSGTGDFLADPASAHFGNRIRDLFDEVRLFLTPVDVRTMANVLDVSCIEDKKVVQLLLARLLDESYDGSSLRVPYLEALLAVKAMVRAAITQFKRLEDKARAVEVLDLLQRGPAPETIEEAETEDKNLIDANKLLSALVQLEDQLYQIASQSDVLSEEAKVALYSREMSRAHTAHGRLSSLLVLPSYKQASPLALAEQGICNIGDGNLSGGLRFYQQHQVELESLHQHTTETGRYDARAALETQFKNDLFTRGFETWNVQMGRSINSMPSKSHQTGLRGKSLAASVSGVHPLATSDFVLSSSNGDASVNVWSTRAGLTHISALNFKL